MATNVPLNVSRQKIIEAYNSGDQAGLQSAISDYKQTRRSLKRSQANIRADQAREGPGGTVLEGVGGGMLNVARRGARMLTPRGSEEKVGDFLGLTEGNMSLDDSIAEQARLDERGSGRFKGGKFAGEMIATAPLGGAAGGAVKLGARALTGANQAGKVGRGLSYLAEGAVGGQAVEDNGAASGGAMNVLLSPLLNRGGRVLRTAAQGMNRTKEADRLLKLGADLTPGQLNPKGILNRMEKTSEFSPLAGAGIRTAREQALDPVVPNYAADIIGGKRVRMGTEETAKRVGKELDRLYGQTGKIALRAPRQADLDDFRKTVQASIRTHSPTDPREVGVELASVWKQVARAKTAGELKTVLSDLRGMSRALKYSKEGKGTSRFRIARVYDDAAKWIDARYKSGMTPDQIADVSRADKIVARYKPLESAIERAQLGGRTAPSGRDMLRGLRKSMTRRQFTSGEGGATRRIADAMEEVQKPRPGGIIERNEYLRAALGTAVLPVSALGGMRGTRRALQGSYKPQRFLRAAGKRIERDPHGRFLKRSLLGLRAGVAPATLDSADQE